jgi:hypothetical protein
MRTAALTLRAVPRLALALPARARRWVVVALLLAIVAAAGYYGWLRDSSLVRVDHVTVVGLTGPDADRVRERLERAGLDMTTLHVREDELRAAVAAEPSILTLRATPDFPHDLRIDVTENHPVAAIDIAGSGRVPIAGNGTLMPGHRGGAVPHIKLTGSARVGRDGGSAARLADKRAAALVAVAASAPPALLRRAGTVEQRRGEGTVVVLRDGPRIMFGDGSRLRDKWRAATGVLASKDAQGAAYIDVRLADRPVAGGLKPPIPAAGAPSGEIAPTPEPVAPAPSTPTPESAAPAPVAPVSPPATEPQP